MCSVTSFYVSAEELETRGENLRLSALSKILKPMNPCNISLVIFVSLWFTIPIKRHFYIILDISLAVSVSIWLGRRQELRNAQECKEPCMEFSCECPVLHYM